MAAQELPDSYDPQECQDIIDDLAEPLLAEAEAEGNPDDIWSEEDAVKYSIPPKKPEKQPGEAGRANEAEGMPIGPEENIILFLENDPDYARQMADRIGLYGYTVEICESGSHLMAVAQLHSLQVVAVILDIRVPSDSDFADDETFMGRRTGVIVGNQLLAVLDSAIFVGLSFSEDAFDSEWFRARGERRFFYVNKRGTWPQTFARRLDSIIRHRMNGQDINLMPLRSFIVHGHDMRAVRSLRSHLQDKLGLPEPVVLTREPSAGLTIMEKFEQCADEVDVVFVLLTPDDKSFKGSIETRRARQNVIFELGYFLQKLGRKSGRVILLKKGDVEMPSDLGGVVTINISKGIRSAAKKIWEELALLGLRID